MRIALVGGTGSIGKGLAFRLSPHHHVIVGSRSEERAKECVADYSAYLKEHGCAHQLEGCTNTEAATKAEVVVLCIPFKFVKSTIEELEGTLDGKVVISPVVPLAHDGGLAYYNPPSEGSAAQLIRKLLPDNSSLAAAFHTIAAQCLSEVEGEVQRDVVVCGESDAKEVTFSLVKDMGFRPLDAGGIDKASLVESLTPLLINIGILNGLKDVGTQFVSDNVSDNK